jgi:hypothetical protein
MIIKVRSTQIPKYWEIIKFAIVKVYSIPAEDILDITNKALAELEADNYQCFFRLSDDGEQVEAIVITSIILNKFTGEKSLSIETLYSFKLQKEWDEFFNFVKEFGRTMGCVNRKGKIVILGYSKNPRAQNIMLDLGFTESFTTYTYIG